MPVINIVGDVEEVGQSQLNNKFKNLGSVKLCLNKPIKQKEKNCKIKKEMYIFIYQCQVEQKELKRSWVCETHTKSHILFYFSFYPKI